MKNNYELVASGEKWIKSDVKSTFRAITEIIDKTQSSLLLTIYIITNNDILEKVKEALDRNVGVEVFIYKDKVNGSACIYCLLLPETSCEHNNMWLDRHLLTGE